MVDECAVRCPVGMVLCVTVASCVSGTQWVCLVSLLELRMVRSNTAIIAVSPLIRVVSADVGNTVWVKTQGELPLLLPIGL